MAIRMANYNDVNAVYELICELEKCEFNKEKFKTTYKINLINDSLHYYVFEEDEIILGFGSLAVLRPLHHEERVAEIQELIVRKEARGRGVGKAILIYIESIARSLNLERIEIASNLKRLDAHRFYEREGYLKTHTKLNKLIPL